MTLESGTFLHNRYRIHEILGQGGMGSIYMAVDENLGVDVALKENLFTTEEYARQFRLEAVILANLRHLNLPRVSDHFVIDGQGQYLVMDYIEGEDLRDIMDRTGNIPEVDILDIGISISDALTYMHSRKPPVLHRDIKPGNVRITPQGEIFLVDFGLAKIVDDDQQTSTGARAMTPGYSPPEQYGAARTDHRSDIYSLAATMYAAVVGNIPEDSLARTMDQTELTPIRERNSEITPMTARTIERALQVLPAERFQTAEDFKQELINARIVSFPDSATKFNEYTTPIAGFKPISMNEALEVKAEVDEYSEDASLQSLIEESSAFDLGSEAVKPPKSKLGPRSIYIAVVVITLLAFGISIAYFVNPAFPNRFINALSIWVGLSDYATPVYLLDETVEPTFGVEDRSSATTLTATDPFGSSSDLTSTILPTTILEQPGTPTPTSISELAATPIGGGSGQFAFVSDRTGLPQIWLINVDGSGLHQITDTQWGACQPDWSPDGSQLVYTSPCEGDQETYQGSGLFIINADGTNPTSLPVQGLGDYDPSWSPDGTKIAFTSLSKNDRPQILVWDLENEEVETLSIGDIRDIQPSWTADGSQIIFVSTRFGPYQIWIMDADGSNQHRFSASGGLKDTNPVLSPNGKLLVFNQSRGPGTVPHIEAAPFPDGSEQEYALYNSGVIPMKDADFSTDGSFIIVESWPDGAMHDIYIIASIGAGFTQVTSHPAVDFDPAWRPVEP